ncbi:MAG TPA: hypothetical protein VET24_01445, partial [Actinomycetota bacterium]|nr:hypothetical protein [Actinomycetota bacterium]
MLYHAWQQSAGGSFTGWSSLGGPITGGPLAARWPDGRLEVFVFGWDNSGGGACTTCGRGAASTAAG